MKQYTVAVFGKGQWMEAFLWQNAKIAEGYKSISTTYVNGQTIKIATNEQLTSKEQQSLVEQVAVI